MMRQVSEKSCRGISSQASYKFTINHIRVLPIDPISFGEGWDVNG